VRRALLPVLVALLLAAGASAGPVKITSDSFVVDDAGHTATFTGDVVVTRTNLTVWADNVLVEYGEAGPSSVKSFTASGGVKVKTKEQTATGDRAVYDPKSQMLRLTGHVMVTNGKGSIGSADLLIDLKSNLSTFSSGKGGRVSGVFTAP
jgi:lipopolysaccharide export system protein LptA